MAVPRNRISGVGRCPRTLAALRTKTWGRSLKLKEILGDPRAPVSRIGVMEPILRWLQYADPGLAP